MQVDDPKVHTLAVEIAGQDRDAAAVARKLLDWVFENLAKEATVSVPNAVQVLEMRKGDCNEHAVLYAALARAAGLPARMVAGTVYNPGEGDSSGAFYYHAWNLVWLGRWVAVDPTFGQFPADATHVAFVEGGPDKDIALIGAIGRIRFEVESFG
jgi:transglutaminase-like putative cysteine protease